MPKIVNNPETGQRIRPSSIMSHSKRNGEDSEVNSWESYLTGNNTNTSIR